MVTWRGWGFLVLVTGTMPLIFTVPFALGSNPAPSGSITGYFVWPLLVSAGLTHGLDRLLRRYSYNKRHDFMDIGVDKWVFIFIAIAVVIAGVWVAEQMGWMP
jgi:hypothetical protein